MISLFVFVEGDDDVAFMKDIVREKFLNHSINIIPIPYPQSRNHLVKKQIKTADASENYDYVLISDWIHILIPASLNEKSNVLENWTAKLI